MLCTAVLPKLYDDPKDIADTMEEKFVFRLIVISLLY